MIYVKKNIMAKVVVTARVDEQIKAKALAVLAPMGLTEKSMLFQ